VESEEIRSRVAEEVKKGKVVIIHPEASKKFKGGNVAAIDYPK